MKGVRIIIPKIIHYCWFGHGEYDDKIKYCMSTWKKVCPDYEIMRWDEDSFDLGQCKYAEQAYEKKRWAFVTDYVRLKVLDQYGGIYLDTDMELLTSFDGMLNDRAFLSFKRGELVFGITSAVMATEKENPFFRPLIDQFESREYLGKDGEEDVTPIAKFLTEQCMASGIRLVNEKQRTDDGLVLYPNEVLCPTVENDGSIHITPQTCAIHHFLGSWRTPELMEYFREKLKNAKEGEIVI